MAGPSLETLRWAGTRPAPVTVEQTVCAMDDDESGTVLLNVGHRATGPLRPSTIRSRRRSLRPGSASTAWEVSTWATRWFGAPSRLVRGQRGRERTPRDVRHELADDRSRPRASLPAALCEVHNARCNRVPDKAAGRLTSLPNAPPPAGRRCLSPRRGVPAQPTRRRDRDRLLASRGAQEPRHLRHRPSRGRWGQLASPANRRRVARLPRRDAT
jgi:hypothetical protein